MEAARPRRKWTPSSTAWKSDQEMKLTKFERRKQDILKRHEEELLALEEAERKEREKLIEPIIEKLTKLANEEARKILEKNPEILETYSFRKREAGRAISAALEALFADEGGEDEDAAEAPEISAPAPVETVTAVVPEAGSVAEPESFI